MKLFIKYMVSVRCMMIVQFELEKFGIDGFNIALGEVDLKTKLSNEQLHLLKVALLKYGLELMDDKKAILIEKIRIVIIEMVHHLYDSPKINYSELISKKLKYDYTYLSNLFSEATGITIEQYVIAHKIEKVKELLFYNELNLTQISDVMSYSSVSHLSRQFKKVTGLTPTDYRLLKQKPRNTLDKI